VLWQAALGDGDGVWFNNLQVSNSFPSSESYCRQLLSADSSRMVTSEIAL
jgi:hypothetical protein